MGGNMLTFEESIFYANGQKKDVISSSSSLDAIEVAKEEFGTCR